MAVWRKRRPSAPASDGQEEFAVVKASRYFPFQEQLETTGFLAVVLRLPRLMGQAAGWAWRASPKDTAATVVLNVAAGAFTAFALVAVAGVLEELFAEGPTPQRVWAA